MAPSIEIPGYKIKKELGAGGMAKVYLALDKKLDRPVALKILSPSLAENSRITKRFVKEAKIAAQLQHSNIVSIFDVGKHQGIYYFSMEYLSENLKDRIKQSGVIKPREALAIVREISKALVYAHNKGYVHRDIKPDNIMFRKDGVLVLVDFGIVKAVNEKTKLTRTGISVGTPQYMSPEQIKAKKLDGRSDIYSLGIVLFELLTGHPPYKSKDLVKLALQHTGDPIPQLPARLKDLQPLIEKMLAKNTHERVRNAEGLIRLIDAIDHELKIKTTKIHQIPKDRRKKTPILLIFVLMILLGIASIYLLQESNRKREINIWENAIKMNSIDTYQHYLKEYPSGKFKNRAKSAIDGIIKNKKYKLYFKKANNYFKQGKHQMALEMIKKAKEYKLTSELISLEQDINRGIGNPIE